MAAAGGHGPGRQLAHTVMMLGTVWMISVMSAAGAMQTSDAQPMMRHATVSSEDAVAGVAVTVALAVSGLVLLVDTIRFPRRHRHLSQPGSGHLTDRVTATAMSLGMAAMTLPMLAIPGMPGM